jgi:tRNA pseudouridine32 synthase/23S rRNA pseudouridine746 synthase
MDLSRGAEDWNRKLKLHFCRRRTQETILYAAVLLVIPWFPNSSLGLALSALARSRIDLLCPGSHPSEAFLAPHLHISCKTVEWGERSQMLPVQRYHARRSIERRDHDGEYCQNVAIGSTVAFPRDFQCILDTPTKFNLSTSTLIHLERYYGINPIGTKSSNHPKKPVLAMTKSQEDALWKKILAEHRASQPIPEHALEILYCDADICVVNKPSGILSVPGPRRNPSLANLVYETLQPASIDLDQTVVHRLDMATSGIMVYALSVEALSNLHLAFKERNVQKTYEALVEGHLGGGLSCYWEGEIDVDLERDPDNPPHMRIAQPRTTGMAVAFESALPNDDDDEGSNDNKVRRISSSIKKHKFWRQAPKPCQTTWSVLRREYRNGRPVTRMELRPHTGRTHQLRVHTSQILGAPIVGDDIYGFNHGLPDDENGAQLEPDTKLCLHAKRLCIFHPISGAAMIFEADPPF